MSSSRQSSLSVRNQQVPDEGQRGDGADRGQNKHKDYPPGDDAASGLGGRHIWLHGELLSRRWRGQARHTLADL